MTRNLRWILCAVQEFDISISRGVVRKFIKVQL